MNRGFINDEITSFLTYGVFRRTPNSMIDTSSESPVGKGKYSSGGTKFSIIYQQSHPARRQKHDLPTVLPIKNAAEPQSDSKILIKFINFSPSALDFADFFIYL